MSATAPILIQRDMPVAEIVAFLPQSQSVLAEYGLHCFGCEGSAYETLEQGCKGHGFDDAEIDALVTDLNDLLTSGPSRPMTLAVTAEAARAIEGVAREEQRTDEGLAVIVDEHGGFCMEFRPEPQADEETFHNTEVPSVRIFASTLTLKRIGGATIDFRDGRFKLDLEEDKGAGCGCGGSCSCA